MDLQVGLLGCWELAFRVEGFEKRFSRLLSSRRWRPFELSLGFASFLLEFSDAWALYFFDHLMASDESPVLP